MDWGADPLVDNNGRLVVGLRGRHIHRLWLARSLLLLILRPRLWRQLRAVLLLLWLVVGWPGRSLRGIVGRLGWCCRWRVVGWFVIGGLGRCSWGIIGWLGRRLVSGLSRGRWGWIICRLGWLGGAV